MNKLLTICLILVTTSLSAQTPIHQPFDQGGYSFKSIDTVSQSLSTLPTYCSEVWIMNNTPTAVVYVGLSSAVTKITGFGALGYHDTIRVPINNMNKVYLISTVMSTDVRYIYFRY